MTIRPLSLAVLIPVLTPPTPTSKAQTSDPQAVAILQQALIAAGGTRGLAWIQDFTATGTITYFWARQQVPGTATVKGRGSDQFRLDSSLPPGTRSHAVSHERGALRDLSGRITRLSYHNTINTGILTFPYLSVAAVLSDPLTTVSYVALVAIGGRQAHQIRVQRHFGVSDPQGIISNLSIKDYFVDALTSLIVKTTDMTHPPETYTTSFPHEVELQSYGNVGGINMPMLVCEKILSQTVWEIRLSGVSFNTGLTDLDFVLQ